MEAREVQRSEDEDTDRRIREIARSRHRLGIDGMLGYSPESTGKFFVSIGEHRFGSPDEDRDGWTSKRNEEDGRAEGNPLLRDDFSRNGLPREPTSIPGIRKK